MKCPLCDKEMMELWGEDLHYRCGNCNRGWYIADLMAFAGKVLAGYNRKNKQSGELVDTIKQVREFILKNEGGSNDTRTEEPN